MPTWKKTKQMIYYEHTNDMAAMVISKLSNLIKSIKQVSFNSTRSKVSTVLNSVTTV